MQDKPVLEREISFFGDRKVGNVVKIWLPVLLLSIGATVYLTFAAIWHTSLTRNLYILLAMAMIIAFMILAIALLKATKHRHRNFVIFSLAVTGISFIVNGYILSHEVFSPLTMRTKIALWISSIALFLSIYFERMSMKLRIIVQAFMVLGIFASIAFVIVLLPAMPAGWLAIPIFGIGFLPYGPLIVAIAFGTSWWLIDQSLNSQQRERSRLISGLVLLTLITYSFYFGKLWFNTIATFQKQTKSEIGRNHVDADLPSWLRIAQNTEPNHVTEILLQPQSDRRLGVFSTGRLFDPLAFIVSLFDKTKFLDNETRENLLRVLYGHSHTHLERLWSGHGLVTTTLDTHVQIFPEGRVAYAETVLAVYNEDKFGQQEAIYTMTVPEGAICTKLSLWVGNEERPARLTFASTAKTAYKTVVGYERRDPAYIEWLDGNRLRLRIFPVDHGQYRTVRLGLIVPLASRGNELVFQSTQFEGPDASALTQKIQADVFTNAKPRLNSIGVALKEKIVPDGQVAAWHGKTSEPQWSIRIPKSPLATKLFADGKALHLAETEATTSHYEPEAIALILNTTLDKSEWRKTLASIQAVRPEIPVYLVSSEWFNSKDTEKNSAWLKDADLPQFNVFPLYLSEYLPKKYNEILFVTAGEKISAGLGELTGSKMFSETQKFQRIRRDSVKIVDLSGKPSSYVKSLAAFHMAEVIGSSNDDLKRILETHSVRKNRRSETEIPIRASGVTLRFGDPKTQNEKSAAIFSDYLLRLAMHEQIMRSLGRRYFEKDLENSDLVDYAARGAIVSPVSTLIVLETDKDYDRFGIKANAAGMGQSGLKKPGVLGSVPEPGEWLLLISLVFFMAWYYRRRLRLRQA